MVTCNIDELHQNLEVLKRTCENYRYNTKKKKQWKASTAVFGGRKKDAFLTNDPNLKKGGGWGETWIDTDV